MKQTTSKRSLEGLRIFPYFAWALIGLFALFVYNLTEEVSAITEQLQTTRLEQAERLQNQQQPTGPDTYEPTASAQ